MKGNNTLKLNSSTVIAALQEYLDKRYTPHIEVTAVTMVVESGETSFLVQVGDDMRKVSGAKP